MRKSIRSRLALGLFGLALVAVAGLVAAGVSSSGGSSMKAGVGRVAKSGDPDANMKNLAGIANEGPDASLAAQEEAERAYPAESVPEFATQNSISTFRELRRHGNGRGNWESIGPSQAKYPALLDQFLAGGKEYIASGRVTAMAIGGCKKNDKCRIYLGAAGGGVWVADRAREDDAHWQFRSGSFATNAIGSLLVDPRDPSGSTVYAGTGEPNASGDSEAGMGIYKSRDGGDSWSLVPGSDAFKARSISSMTIDNAGNLLVGVARGVRGISSVTGGAVSNPPSPFAALGLYRQTGGTFTQIWDGAGSVRGVNDLSVDPNNSSVLYAAAFQVGVWRSLDNGMNWTQIKTPRNAGLNTDRAEFAVNKLPGGLTRMYVGVGNSSTSLANQAHIFRTDDAAGAAPVFTDLTTAQSVNYCTGQCWYDNVVVSPAGAPDVVYLGGSFDYATVNASTNGRAVLLSTDGGMTWSDMTRDKNDDGWLHPDQHALVTIPGDPLQFVAGHDGGVARSNGKFVDKSSDCDTRGLDAAGTAYCKSLLSRVPRETAILNQGLRTLQFQSLSVDPKHPKNSLMGGTQDNGTFEYKGSSNTWPQIIYGDGGQSGWNAADSNLRFNTFTGQASDVNFRDGDPAYWVIATGPIAGSPENSYFYPPIIADPRSAQAGSIFQGSMSVWRTQDWGGNQAYLEANCPEFTTSAAAPNCGDFVRIGPALATDLTGTAYGPDRLGSCDTLGTGCVAAIERATSNAGTMWAATGTGRVFITDNANDPAASVVWTRLDSSATNDPQRFVSSIYIDPANANHVWISYSGYNFNTAAQPGHVFEVTRVGAVATWVDRTYDLADLPVTDLVRDDLTGDLYASTDFGVMKLASGATSWTIAASGMPMVETPGLTIVPKQRILYAATHGLGAWRLDLPDVSRDDHHGDDGDHGGDGHGGDGGDGHGGGGGGDH